jgi:hypothetical protein
MGWAWGLSFFSVRYQQKVWQCRRPASSATRDRPGRWASAGCQRRHGRQQGGDEASGARR